jgi:hypothetical protein
MRSKLTAEDVAWLEERLSAAMVPVTPRAAFVNDAKRALLSTMPGDECGDEDGGGFRWVLPVIATAFTFIGLALFFAALRRRQIC